MKDNEEIIFEQTCVCCGKKFKSTSFIQDICNECSLEYVNLLVGDANKDNNEYLVEELLLENY